MSGDQLALESEGSFRSVCTRRGPRNFEGNAVTVETELDERRGQLLPGYGLLYDRAAPSSRPLVRSATIEMTMTGMCVSAGVALIRLRSSQPSMLGSMTSTVISNSGCCAARTSASSPTRHAAP